MKLNKDMTSFSGEITKNNSFAKIPGQQDPFRYQEGPWAYERKGHYYMAYASTCRPEGIGYAMSQRPDRPLEVQRLCDGPQPGFSGNHPGLIDYKGRSYVFGFNYYLNSLQPSIRERRSACVEEMTYNADGTIPALPWWNTTGPPRSARWTRTSGPRRRLSAGSRGYQVRAPHRPGGDGCLSDEGTGPLSR